MNEWMGFHSGIWQQAIDVNDFIVRNYTPYDSSPSFLSGPSERTGRLWRLSAGLLKQEHENKGVLDIDVETISGINSFQPGYIDRNDEVIVGLQTDKPLKRMVNPYGGIRLAQKACRAYGYTLDTKIEALFKNYRKTHNEGVFSAYTEDMKKVRHSGLITGLPDSYGRGRIIGDYRRVALYGITRLIDEKEQDLSNLLNRGIDDAAIRLREEVTEQTHALKALALLGDAYGFNLRFPAKNAQEAIQWTYMAFLGSIRETNGAANSLGRLNTFFDIFIERDIRSGQLNEALAQELIDQLVIKLRLVRHLRTPEYNELFAGDPVWITEVLGGIAEDGRHMVTKTSYRFLQTLINLGSAPEPNLTILWSARLPKDFKDFCAHISIETSAIQFENDDLMRPFYGSDYGISCCVSAMRLGKDMQYFGARCNLPKLLLLALNGGRDELSGEQIAPDFEPMHDEFLDYDKVMIRFNLLQKWLTGLYVGTMNTIHYMHDKYAYERLMMALHDTDAHRYMAFGIAGLSVVSDSMSAIRYAKVRPIRNEAGLCTDFEIAGDFPKYGNDDDRVDLIAVDLVKGFMNDLKKHKTYRDAEHTLSILTITSNVVYGKKTGATPDGRKAGESFAPGANPMHGRDTTGALAVMNSLSKIPYSACKDGISLTLSLTPNTFCRHNRNQCFTAMLDGYFLKGGHHVNINVLDRSMLEDAMNNPAKYPQLTIRVSGYAVNFHRLTREQQLEVISRTIHTAV